MVVLGIVGSPRKNGRSNALIDASLIGAKSEGVKTKKIFLIDFNVKPYTSQDESDENSKYCPEELSDLCEEADAIIISAPVYWGDINGLTKDFMDSVRISNSNGKPALGIAVAGGTGKGLLSGVQSIYHFFFHRQMRGIDPTPVSRFNFEEALGMLKESGSNIANLGKVKNPFYGEKMEDRWSEILFHYSTLKYLGCDILDEFIVLANQLIRISKGPKVENAKTELDKALTLIQEGKRAEASHYTVEAYQLLYFPE